MIKKKRYVKGLLMLFIFCLFGIGLVSASFEINNLFIKVSSQIGDSSSKSISIFSDSGGDFNLELLGLENVKISEESFFLKAGETKNINLNFNSVGIEAGAYVGSLKVSEGAKTEYLPIIFEIKSKDKFFDLSLDIPPQYSEISPGDKLVPQIKIFDLTFGTASWQNQQSVTLEYYIYDIFGNKVYSESEDVLVNKDIQITKTISLSKKIKEGDYVLSVIIKHKFSVSASSEMFSVKKTNVFSNLLADNSKLLIILGAIVLFFLIMIGFFVYIVRDRDKFIFELKKFNALEMKKQKEFLNVQARLIQKKKNISQGVLEKEIKKKIRQLKARQFNRVKEFRVLKRKGSINEMKKKLREWKSRGYNTMSLEYKLKGVGVKEMKRLMKKWGKKPANQRV